MRSLKIILILMFCYNVLGDRTTENPRMVRFFKNFLGSLTGKTTNTKGLENAKKLHKIQKPLPDNTPFPCDTKNGRSSERPTSVHKLRPGDIDVIGSMGDSLSAGNGLAASRVFHITIDNRGLSWAIGGRGTWKQYLTLPNILKEYNPNLVGYASEDAYGYMNKAQFSVAEPGAMSRDMPHSVKILLQRIKKDPRVDFENDWKLINLFISGNDFCTDVCYLKEPQIEKSHETHRQDLYKVFDYLRDYSPRTIVNFIKGPKTNIGTDFVGKSNACDIAHKFECPCIFGEAHKFRMTQMHRVQENWIKVEEEIAKDERYRNKEDFAIVFQPFITNSLVPKLSPTKSDFSYVSTDCYHFSQKGGARVANAVWNNMLEPVGNKSLQWEPIYKKFLCPSNEHPYIFTWANSLKL